MGGSTMAGVMDRGRRFVARHGVGGLPAAAKRSLAARLLPTRPEYLVDASDADGDPLDALRLAGDAVPLVRVPMARLRTYAMTIDIDDVDHQPFTRTVAEHLDGRSDGYAGSALERFYGGWQPANLGAVYGVRPSSDSPLAAAPSPDCLPWIEGANAGDIAAGRSAHERKVRALVGSDAAMGYRSFGPVSPDAGEVYYRDYVDLADSIVAKGYVEGMNDYPQIEVLAVGDEWVGRLLAGNHRCVVLAALGTTTVRVRVARRVIRREQSATWPGVRSGLYSPDEAVEVFDRFWHGAAPVGFPELGRAIARPDDSSD